MAAITITPIGTISHDSPSAAVGSRKDLISTITLSDHIPTEAFDLIGDFSHLQIIFQFNGIDSQDTRYSGHPRNRPAFPNVGIFVHCSPRRPNHLGMTIVQLLSHDGRTITVKGLDAFNGTPVIDIKPVFKDLPALHEIRQPGWADQIVREDTP